MLSRGQFFSAIGFCFLISISIPIFAADITATYNSLGIRWSPEDGGSDAPATIRYRELGIGPWYQAHALWWEGSEYRGSIVHLKENTTYELELILGGDVVETVSNAKTWSEQFPIGETIYLESGFETINITESGTPNAYRLYTAMPGKNVVLDAAGKSNNSITINASYVIVRGLKLVGAKRSAIRIRGGHDIVIEDNEITGFSTSNMGYDAGVRVNDVTSVTRITIQRNYIHRPAGAAHEWCSGQYTGQIGINLSETSGHHVIRYNTIFSEGDNYFSDCISLGGFDPNLPDGNSDIYGNHIAGCSDNAIEAEGGNLNTRIWGNYMDRSYTPVAIAPSGQGPVYIFRNVSDRSLKCPYSNADNTDKDVRGRFVKAGAKSDSRVYIYHNTIYQRPPENGQQHELGLSKAVVNSASGGGARNMISRNNIFDQNKDRKDVFSGEKVNNFDYDLYRGRVSSSENNGIKGRPTYSDNNALLEFFLSPQSLGVDAGQLLHNFSHSPNGTMPDMGAYETGMAPLEFGVNAYSHSCK
ncbi:MAG: right-handed parallel beta-helix repeat-containing protein [Endozoicomonas sp.]